MNKTPHKEERPKSKKWKHITWLNAQTKYVNAETGEELTKNQKNNGNYIKVHTDYFYQIEKDRPIGHIHRTERYITNGQQSLFD